MSADPEHNIAAIILAAGKGTRMESDKAKVLHLLAGRPMIHYVLDAAAQIAGNAVIVVVGTQAEEVRAAVSARSRALFAYQARQLGTGHAVLCAMTELPKHTEHVLILCGDVPMITARTLQELAAQHIRGCNDLTVMGARVEDPTGYGRIKQRTDGTVLSIVEESDAAPSEKSIQTVNTGMYCANRNFLEKALLQIRPNNAQKEMYFTDIVEIAAHAGMRVGLMLCPDSREMIGVNSREDLKRVETMVSSK